MSDVILALEGEKGNRVQELGCTQRISSVTIFELKLRHQLI